MALIALAAMGPIRDAHAYVDPNSAGPLFQFLFPLFIAVASFLATCRRYVGRLWRQMKHTVMTGVRGESTGTEDRIDPS